MDKVFSRFIKGDKAICLVFLILCVISAIVMFSASSTLAYKSSSHVAPLLQHITFLIFGIAVAFLVQLINPKLIKIFGYLGLALSWLFLIYALLRGVSHNDAARWVQLFGVQFQPSELAKLSLIIVISDMIDRSQNPNEKHINWFLYIILASGFTCVLILFENLSTALILFAVIVLMMFIGKLPMKKLSLLLFSLIALAAGSYFLVKAIPSENMPALFDRAYTWVSRVDNFLSPEANKFLITDENRQVAHGQMAVARGGILGVGPGNSIERDFLPGAFSDFIYSIILEEFGSIGGGILILLYLVILFRAGMITKSCETVYSAILVIGVALIITLQAFVSMAVSVHLGPVTGQPLPLISRGGTSIIATCIYFGLILNVTRYNEKKKNSEQENEFIIDLENKENEQETEILD